MAISYIDGQIFVKYSCKYIYIILERHYESSRKVVTTPNKEAVLRELFLWHCRVQLWKILDALRGNLETNGVPTFVRVAHEFLHDSHRYLRQEFIAGHAPGAINIINIPYMYKNPYFLAEVSKYFRKDDEIIVGCLGGKRSLMAAIDLLASLKFVLMFGFNFLLGYSCFTDIPDGYAAWTQNAHPKEL
ncbi:hypothetical protein UlMin_030683 [Ulmus minor]